MIVFGCVALICISGIVGLKMWLDSKPEPLKNRQQIDDELKLHREELVRVEQLLVKHAEKIIGIEKLTKMRSGPEPVMRRDESLQGGPMQRKERLAAAQAE